MDELERLKKYERQDFDVIIMHIRNGLIKVGRYADKHDDTSKLGKELFTDE